MPWLMSRSSCFPRTVPYGALVAFVGLCFRRVRDDTRTAYQVRTCGAACSPSFVDTGSFVGSSSLFRYMCRYIYRYACRLYRHKKTNTYQVLIRT